MVNSLIPLPKSTETVSSDDVYRQLGAMTLLNMQAQGETFSESLGDFYAHVLSAMQQQSVFIALSSDRQPMGYVSFEQREGVRVIQRLVAPFGDHLAVLKSFKHRYDDLPVVSHNPRSANQEQTV